MTLEVGASAEALEKAIRRCATDGSEWLLVNSENEIVWGIEADSKVDPDDLSFPVIVHMRSGSLDARAVLMTPDEYRSTEHEGVKMT